MMNNSKSKKYNQKLLAIGYLIALPCLFLSMGMNYSIKVGAWGVLLFRDLVVYPVLFASCLTGIVGTIKCFVGFVQNDKKHMKALSFMLIFVSSFSIYGSHYFLQHYCYPYNIFKCQLQLRNLFEAMTAYRHNYDAFPPANQWCDALYQHMKKRDPDFNFDHRFVCAGGSEGRCNFALNPNVTKSSHEDIVLIYDTVAGWNIYGGREMMNLNNHEGKGCNVLFVNGTIKFIPKDKIDDLKWVYSR